MHGDRSDQSLLNFLADPAKKGQHGTRYGTLRVVRGGAWVVADVRMVRCSHRQKVPPDTYSYAIGFRVASSG